MPFKKNYPVFSYTLSATIISHSFVLFAIIFAWLGPAAGVGGHFCEAAREGLIKQPANTFSNLAFAFWGLIAAYQLDKKVFKNKNAITQKLFFGRFFCVLMVLLSPGSMAMHATETYWGGYFDMLSMYLIAAIIFSYALERLLYLSPKVFSFIFGLVLLLCHYFHFGMVEITFPLVGFSGNFIFAIFLLLTAIIEFYNLLKNKPNILKRWGLLAIFTFLLSFGIWFIGRNDHPWCHPYSFLQAHALWHILDATALYFLFRFYVSEKDAKYSLNNT